MRRVFRFGFAADLVGNSSSAKDLEGPYGSRELAYLQQEFSSEWKGGEGESWASALQWNPERRVFQAVLVRPDRAFDLAVALTEAFWPASCRTALVAGSGFSQPGPAEQALELLTAHAGGPGSFTCDLPGRSPQENELVEIVAKLHNTLMSEWTPTRWKAVRAYRRLGRQRAVAEDLGVTQQAVSQMLRGARLRELQKAEDCFRRWLQGKGRPGIWPLPGERRSSTFAETLLP
ncbi:MAG: hypothetical protein DWQ01_22230 [Planctomycetota bacterium]|nr:MAG: hypothetical protein DWQ01_22230 [Planctomycetota bacterium]